MQLRFLVAWHFCDPSPHRPSYVPMDEKRWVVAAVPQLRAYVTPCMATCRHASCRLPWCRLNLAHEYTVRESAAPAPPQPCAEQTCPLAASAEANKAVGWLVRLGYGHLPPLFTPASLPATSLVPLTALQPPPPCRSDEHTPSLQLPTNPVSRLLIDTPTPPHSTPSSRSTSCHIIIQKSHI